MPADAWSGEGLLPGSWTALCILRPHTATGARVLSGLSYKGTDPIHEGSTITTHHLPEPTSHSGLDFNVKSWGTQTFSPYNRQDQSGRIQEKQQSSVLEADRRTFRKGQPPCQAQQSPDTIRTEQHAPSDLPRPLAGRRG